MTQQEMWENIKKQGLLRCDGRYNKTVMREEMEDIEEAIEVVVEVVEVVVIVEEQQE